MEIIALDFETYYDKAYSLSKMTTEAYINDPQFEIILVTVCDIHNTYHTIDGAIGEDAIAARLEELGVTQYPVAAHHAAFDMAITSWRLGLVPPLILDTMSMAAPLIRHETGSVSLAKVAEYFHLPAKGTEVHNMLGRRRASLSSTEFAAYAKYCRKDTMLCRNSFELMLPDLPRKQLLAIDRVIRMYVDPKLEIDEELCKKALEESVDKLEALIRATGLTEEVLASSPQFAKELEKLVSVPMKTSKVTGKRATAFSKKDADFHRLLSHPNPTVRTLVKGRMAVKSTQERTRFATFLGIAQRMNQLPVALKYYGAHTGRLSAWDDTNLQNLSKKSLLRKAIRAPKGFFILAADQKQVECRVNAVFSGQWSMVEAFRKGEDLYSDFATDLYNHVVTQEEYPDERFVGKTCVAEGSLVLTDAGLVPIEEIKLGHRLWDGVDWVQHEGVVCRGLREVIQYDGLTATGDHYVITEDYRALPFGEAASSMARLLRSVGNDGTAIRVDKDRIPAHPQEERIAVRNGDLLGQRGNETNQPEQSDKGQIQELLCQRGEPISLPEAVQATGRCARAVCNFIASSVQVLRRARDRVSIHLSTEGSAVGITQSWSSTDRDGVRPQGQRRALRTGESSLLFSDNASAESEEYGARSIQREDNATGGIPQSLFAQYDVSPSCERETNWRANHRNRAECGGEETQELARDSHAACVYDIVNAGPRHCFTVSGRLVLNCVLGLGFQMGAERLMDTMAPTAVPITLDFSQICVDKYRQRYLAIVKNWSTAKQMLYAMINGDRQEWGPLITGKHCMLLPNGMKLNYPNLYNSGRDEDGIMYEERVRANRVGSVSGWTRIYGGKLVENCVQAMAGEIVMDQLIRLSLKYPVVLQEHDKIGFLIEKSRISEACDEVEKVMTARVPWMPNLPLAVDVKYGETYADC